MRFVIQRVTSSAVRVGQSNVAQIGPGVNILVGIAATDTDADIDFCVRKLLRCKLWEAGAMDRLFPAKHDAPPPQESGEKPPSKPWAISLADEPKLQILLVSQFTLHAKLKKPRPDFHYSMDTEAAQKTFDQVAVAIRKALGAEKADAVLGQQQDESAKFQQRVQSGEFGAYMSVSIENDGPVTIWVDSDEGKKSPISSGEGEN